MKRKLLIFGLMASMCAATLIGCGKKSSDKDEKETTTEKVSTEEKTTEITTEATTEEVTEVNAEGTTETDYSDVYSEVIEQYRSVIYSTDEDYIAQDGENGVAEYKMNFGTESAARDIGYAIEDISGDGVPELVIGLINDAQTGEGYEIFAVYTCVDGKPQYVFEGWARSAYFIMEDNKLFYSGSGGAMYSIFGIFRLKEDGTKLECDSYYFTYEKDDSYEEIGYYTNTVGEMDKSVSEEITEEDFWNIYAEYEDDFASLTFTPFSGDMSSAVDVAWAEDVMARYSDYTEYVADSSEYESKVAFIAASRVTDFKVLSLELVDFKEDGTIKFDSKEIYSQEELSKDAPLIVTMTFVGEIPNYGISYVDENGQTKTFSIGISGYDGSLFLDEITE